MDESGLMVLRDQPLGEEKFRYHDFIPDIANKDLAEVIPKDISYQASWKNRGGTGAFHVGLARKWDRLEAILKTQFDYDVFRGIAADTSGKDGSVLDQIRDLRRYLLLIEAEMMWRESIGKEP